MLARIDWFSSQHAARLMPRFPALVRIALLALLAVSALPSATFAVGAPHGCRGRSAVQMIDSSQHGSAVPSERLHRLSRQSSVEPPSTESTNWLKTLRSKLKPPGKEELKKLGPGFSVSYLFASAFNMCVMISLSWALFIKTKGASPVLLSPLKFNPAYLAYLSVIYFSYGSVMTPIQILLSVAMTPIANGVLAVIERRCKCSRSMAAIIFTVFGAVTFPLSLSGAVLLGCAVARVPVWL
mmetsp:Transcript_15542/g.35587  ORF Transcript_15542/g.35587 Transcript_15542/m.35587 type:complete len:240 (-) Transcript_15542:36-755(-)